MSKVWEYARKEPFARSAVFDTRLALTLLHHGVTEFATRNTKHFKTFGFKKVFDPID